MTSEEIVSAYIERCNQVNPVINAIVEDRFEAALRDARQVDAFIRSGQKREEALARDTPFLGIPVTVKESIAVKGNLLLLYSCQWNTERARAIQS